MAFISMNPGGLSGYRPRRGMGDYKNVGNWSWEFYPPPYDFLAPRDSTPQPAPVLFPRGIGGCGCGCNGAPGGCGGHGVGDITADLTAAMSGNFGPIIADAQTFLSGSMIGGIPNWMLLIGGVGLLGLAKSSSSGGRRRRS
jgi:hypothetical protein